VRTRAETRLRRLERLSGNVPCRCAVWSEPPGRAQKEAAEAALYKEHGRNIKIVHVVTGVRRGENHPR
jgi:hypothetical protein